MDVGFFDFAKTFNSVNPRFLMAKLKSFDLSENAIRLIRSCLTGRNYRMQVADALSQETRMKTGVPLGPVIGPLLFLLFVNDLPSVANVITLLLADDVQTVSPHS